MTTVTDIKTLTDDNAAKATALEAVAHDLKTKLDAAVLLNTSQASEIAQLKTDLATAQAAAADPAVVAAIATELAATNQALADSAAVNNPAN